MTMRRCTRARTGSDTGDIGDTIDLQRFFGASLVTWPVTLVTSTPLDPPSAAERRGEPAPTFRPRVFAFP